MTVTTSLNRISARRIAGHSLKVTWQNIGVLFRLGAIPLAITIAFDILVPLLVPDELAANRQVDMGSTSTWGLAPFSLIAIVFIPAATAWHRYLRFGDTPDARVRYSWKGTETRYLIWLVVLSVAQFALLAVVFGVIYAATGFEEEALQGWPVVLLIFLAVLAVIVMWIRFAPILPASAAGDDFGLGDAWRLTQGHGFRLAIALFLTGLMIGLIALIPMTGFGLAAISLTATSEIAGLVFSAIAGNLLQFALGAVTLAALSGIYLDLLTLSRGETIT